MRKRDAGDNAAKGTGPSEAEARRARLAAALRENLKKRKLQGRARAATAPGKSTEENAD